MINILITNKHLTKIARNLGEEFNRFEFLSWYHSVNPEFKFGSDGLDRALTNKHFDGQKQTVKVFGLPELSITNDEHLKKFLIHQHGSYREQIIKVLEEDFQINYWDELLNIALNKNNNLSYLTYSSLLSHGMNDSDSCLKNIDKLKILTENMIDSITTSKSKHYSEVLQFLSFGITNKEVFGNNWLVQNLNEIFKAPNDGTSKQFNFYVDKLSNQLGDLDFSGFRPCLELKKVMKGKLPLTTATDTTMPFFWQVDFPRYCLANRVVQQLLQSNCITGLDVIDKFLSSQPEVLSHYVKREKTKISLSVIHEDTKLEAKLNSLLNAVLNKTQLNQVLDYAEFDKSLLLIELGENLSDKNKSQKRTKV